MKRKSNLVDELLPPLTLLVVAVILLEIVIRVAHIPDYVLPTPTAIVSHTIKSFGIILPDFLFTLKVVLIGFFVAVPVGILLAAVFSQYQILVKAITPIIILLVVTPMITLIPIMMLWLGFDPNVRIIVVIIQAVPIIVLNTLTGFCNTEQSKLELAYATGASKLQRFTKIVFPNALPQVFTGVKLGCIFSIIGAISADFVAGTVGLGYRIQQFTKYINIDLVYGTILVIALMGIVMYQLICYAEKRIIIWKK